MRTNSEQHDKAKTIKFFEEFLLAVGGKEGVDGKLILKSLKDKKHTTIKFTRDYIDIHETEEGREKKYKPIDKIKIEKFIENFVRDFEGFIEHLKEELPKFRIDLDNSKYKSYIALIPKDKTTLRNKLFRKKGRTLELPKEVVDNPKWLYDIYIPLWLPEVKGYKFDWARVFNPEEKRWLVLFKQDDDNYFLIEDELLEAWMDKLSPFEEYQMNKN